MTTCYGSLVEKRRGLTSDEKETLRRAQERLDRAERELSNAARARNDLFQRLHDVGVGAQAVADVLELHRTTVQRIMTPSPRYRATRERKT
jgi:hypothetical protein